MLMLSAGQPVCAASAALGGPVAPQESRGRREGNAEPLAAATSCRGRAVCKFGSLIASSAAGFERFWRRPSRCVSRPRRAPRCLEKARTRDAAAPGPCGTWLGAAADSLCRLSRPLADEHSSSHRREEATRKQQAPWPRARRRRALQGQPRGQPHTWTGHAVAARRRAKRDDDQRTTAAPCSLTHHQCNSLPRRPRQRRSVLRPRRVCGTRVQRCGRDLRLRLRL